jgi:endophilin-B
MDVNFRKFASDAGTFFNRAKQFTEEKLGQAERTELDAHYENLLQRSDSTKAWTEKILKQTEAVLQPNPTARYEEFFYTKLDKKRRERMTDVDVLGQDMIDAGNNFGPGTSYGSALIKVGQSEQKLGQAEKEFVQAASNNFLQPLKGFLDGDMKTVQRERKELENRRLDLDAAKTRLRRVKEVAGKTKAEQDLRTAQSEFDRQAEITKLLLEGISSTHAHHLRCLHDFVEAQTNYYAQCHQYMSDLQRQLGSFNANMNLGGGSLSPNVLPTANHSGGILGVGMNSAAPSAPSSALINDHSGKRAKVLYDYDAADMSELSLVADELITVYPMADCRDWVMGERGAQRGRVPLTYIEYL